MKRVSTILMVLFTLSMNSQTSDILYIPEQNSLVSSINYKQVGMYVGSYYTTSFPQPYTYTTPLSIMNRIGLTYVSKGNTYSIMGGMFIENRLISFNLTPDVWLKIHPIRFFVRDTKIMDFSLGLNYSNGFRYGVGLSIPF
jgi:hypothetical protein